MAKRGEDLNEMLRLAFEASPAAMFMVDHNGRIELVNAQCEEIFGFERGEMIGMSVETPDPGRIAAQAQEFAKGFHRKTEQEADGRRTRPARPAARWQRISGRNRPHAGRDATRNARGGFRHRHHSAARNRKIAENLVGGTGARQRQAVAFRLCRLA